MMLTHRKGVINMDDVILNMLKQNQLNSSNIDNESSSNLILERDEQGNLCSYDKTTGKRVGRIQEHGDTNTVAKTFNEIIGKAEI